MKRSILTALVMSVLLWCCFTGFGYLELGVLLDTSVQFSRAGFWLNLLLSLAPYLVCAVIAALLGTCTDDKATLAASFLYLAAAILAFVLAIRLRLPVYHDGHRVYGSYSVYMPPIESCYLLVFFFAFTFTRALAKRRKKI